MRHFEGNRKNIVLQYKPYFNGHKIGIISLGLLKILLLVLTLASPILYKILINDVMIDRKLYILKWVCIGYTAIFVFESIILFVQKLVSNRVYNKINFDIGRKIFLNYLYSSEKFIEKYNTGDLKNRVDTDILAFERFISQYLLEYVYNWLIMIVTAVILLLINVKLSLYAFIMLPLSFWLVKFLGKGVNRTSTEYRNIWGQYEGWLQATIQSWKEVKALNLEKHESIIFTRYWHKLCKLSFMRQIFIYGNYFFIAVKDMFFTKLNLYFIGAILIFNNKLTIATLLLFMKYFEQFFQSINTITNLDIQFKEDIPSIDRVSEVLFVYAEDNRKMLYVRDVKEGIKCSDVYFRYNDDTDFILKDINLNIKNKEKIAIVGKSGSGKSTLAKLLVGMYNPLKGNIKLDGNDMTHIKSASLHRAMGIVMQDSILFNISIKDNLLLAKPDATDEEINEACDKAFISEFINGLPDGYMTLVGEKGVKLSGGQKQRLAIARVILTNPDIIIFDESTSALDHESEKNINNAIENIALEKTVIIIAHRLSTILSVNRVIVMRNGCIVGEGSHSELLGNNVEYDTLFGKQYKKIIAS